MQELSNTEFSCECGHKHSSNIKTLIAGSGVLSSLPKILHEYKHKNILMVSDKNTYKACGEKVLKILSDFKTRSFVFPDDHIDSNLHYTGRLLIEANPNVDFILAVGSGVINDMCRTVSFRIQVPYCIIATAPSMDGYASTISPTFVDGGKFSVPGKTPDIIIGDYEIMKNAPPIMIKAGFGDVLGKVIAKTDWNLSTYINGEHQCKRCQNLVEKAYNKCLDNVDGIAKNSLEAVQSVFEALVLSGIVLSLYDDSRPASGCEHFFGHYWDIVAINKNMPHPLHGISVGVGTYVAALIYEMVSEHLPKDFEYPNSDKIKALLKKAGAPTSPMQLNLSRDDFHKSIEFAWLNKPNRYTVLQFARDKGHLKRIADVLTEKFYG